MRFVILGAGAIGGYVGAALARGGAEVTLVARGPHLEAIQADGLQVLSPRGDFKVQVQATDDLAAVADADAVFIGLKAYSLPALAPTLGNLLSPDTVVIPAQNGVPWWFFDHVDGIMRGRPLESVDPGGVVAAAIPAERVVGTVAYCSTEIVQPGVIRHTEGTRFPLAEADGTVSPRCHEIAESFKAGGLKAPVEPRLREHIWLKLIGNVAFNPLSALTGATLAQMGEQPETRELARQIMQETAAVGEAVSLELPVSIERRLEAGFAVGDHRTSMLQDLEAGKPLELGCLSGAVLELAGLLGVDAPHIAAVHACLVLRSQLEKIPRPTASLPLS